MKENLNETVLHYKRLVGSMGSYYKFIKICLKIQIIIIVSIDKIQSLHKHKIIFYLFADADYIPIAIDVRSFYFKRNKTN
jgi:hypothetical protein